jgi:hypothetical protein
VDDATARETFARVARPGSPDFRLNGSKLRFSFGMNREARTRMSDKHTELDAEHSNTIKHPDDWTTGEEPMTGAQRSYLHTLAEEARVEIDDDLTKAEASKRIDELQQVTGRGRR